MRAQPPALPDGFTVALSRDTVVCDSGRTLYGGSTGRFVHLKEPALRALGGSTTVIVSDPVSATLARLLLDRGLADPRWSTTPRDEPTDVTVVIPVRDRPTQVARLLAGLPRTTPVIVVDDGSADPGALRQAVGDRGRVIRREVSGGPAAARNAGLAVATTPFVAFVDSDVVPSSDVVAVLRRHFEDPAVGLVAPRVLGLIETKGAGWLGRYEAARSSLDLGPNPGTVRPHSRIAYLPSATLMARTAALGAGFEESMEVAEDVDLIWRVERAGWTIRYDPGVVVRHEHRTDTTDWLRRKAFYGTGAALLAKRHGDAVAPMVLSPWTTVVTVAILAQRRWSLPVAALIVLGTTLVTARRLGRTDRPVVAAATVVAIGLVGVANQTMSALTRHYWPLSVSAALVSRRARGALLVAGVLESLLDRRRTGADLDPVRYLLARRLDDLAYGAGVWAGCWRARSAAALLPAVRGIRHRAHRPAAPLADHPAPHPAAPAAPDHEVE